jgi:hypothetical protein
MTQPTLTEALQARDEAIQTAEDHAHAEWLAFALLTVKNLALLGPEFTTDAVWERLDHYGVTTHEPRAMGAVVKRAVRDGLIVSTGRYVKSGRKVNHARPIPVYRGN